MNKDPPETRKQRMVNEALRIANNSMYGYSQRPPSGRWGPDFDCSSFIYYIAHQAGYNVSIGSDRVRFTGTMLKDFEKAGFQVLPFANVGISDLKIGDILLNLALHAEVYVGDGESVSANASEDGGFVGSSGDQTDHEIDKHPVITFAKDWDYILRPPEDEAEDDECLMDVIEEGDEEVPVNYGAPQMTGWPQSTGGNYGGQQGYGYPQANNYRGGMQGNLGQMNGYSQASAGYPHYPQMNGYPQSNMMPPMGMQGMDNDLCFVMGIEGAKNVKGSPNGRKAVFDEDKPLMYILSFDQQGNVNNINVYQFEECSEEMPQHLSPLMNHMGQQQMPMPENMLTQEEIDQLKEMLTNAQSSKSSNESGGSRSSQQSGSRLNARTS